MPAGKGTPTTASKIPEIGIGSTVLLRLGEQRWVPMVIVEVWPDGTVSGEAFTNGSSDGAEAYVKRECFYRPTTHQRSLYAKSVARGLAVGEWQPKE